MAWLAGQSSFLRLFGVSLTWIFFSYIDINIIVHYTAHVISGISYETPLLILYPISFSLMAGTVRWAFLWQVHRKDHLWLVILVVMMINAGVDWLLLIALNPIWEIAIQAFWFTVAMMTITGGIFGAATGILLANGIFDSPRAKSWQTGASREQVETARA